MAAYLVIFIRLGNHAYLRSSGINPHIPGVVLEQASRASFDMSTETTAEPTPRYFWRRAFALFTDLVWMGLVVAILCALINLFSPIRLIEPSVLNSKYCDTTDILPQERLTAVFADERDAKLFQQLCIVKGMFIFESRYLTLTAVKVVDGTTHTRYVTISVDKDGNQIDAVDGSVLLYLLFPVVMAFFLVRRGKTPGKALLQLTVAGDEEKTPTWKQGLMREFLKGIPLVVASLLSIYPSIWILGRTPEELASELPTTDQMSFDAWYFAPTLALSLALLWWMFGSFIKWNGRAYWDRFARTKVVDPAINPETDPARSD